MLRRPKRTYRKILYKHKIKLLNNKSKAQYFIVSCTNALIKKEAIEAARIVISKLIRKRRYINKLLSKRKTKGVLKIKVKCSTPITKKGTKSRMGKGKGAIKEYQAFVHVNDVIFELYDVSLSLAQHAVRKINHKLGISIGLIDKTKNNIV